MALGTFSPKPVNVKGAVAHAAMSPEAEAMRLRIIALITNASNNSPRNLQKTIGPSEYGDPCTRQVALKVAGVEENPDFRDPMPSVLGVAFHAWMEEHLPRDEWIPERRVNVSGSLSGSSDAYHIPTATVVDWKLLGNTAHRDYSGGYMSTKYRVQAHSYGQGFVNQGLPVSRVAVAVFGRSKPLQDLFVWDEQWDPSVAARALERLAIITDYIAATGASNENRAPLQLIDPTPGDNCFFCPFKGSAAQGLCPKSSR